MRFVDAANDVPADASPDELRARLEAYEEKARRFGDDSLVGRAAARLAQQCRERLAQHGERP